MFLTKRSAFIDSFMVAQLKEAQAKAGILSGLGQTGDLFKNELYEAANIRVSWQGGSSSSLCFDPGYGAFLLWCCCLERRLIPPGMWLI